MNTNTRPATHTVAPIIASPATPEGRLAGYETVCYDCGLKMTNTVESNLRFDVRDHIAYWLHKDRAEGKATIDAACRIYRANVGPGAL